MVSRPVFTAVTALTAAALAGVVALPAHAATGSRSHPTAVSAPASATAPNSAAMASTKRPVPKPFHDALVRAARHGVKSARTVTTAAGVRPIGASVSTDLPTRIEIGSPILFTDYTVKVPTSLYLQPAVAIALADARGNLVVSSFLVGTRGQTAFSGSIAVPARALSTIGAAQWIVIYGEADTTSVNLPTAQLGTTIKLRSLLAEKVTRRGDRVDVFGATRAYSPGSDSYIPRFGARVTVQRWAGDGWQNLTTLRTDSHGHIATSIRIPWRVGIRLVSPDEPLAFGAASASASV